MSFDLTVAINSSAPPGRQRLETDTSHGFRCASPVATAHGLSGANICTWLTAAGRVRIISRPQLSAYRPFVRTQVTVPGAVPLAQEREGPDGYAVKQVE